VADGHIDMVPELAELASCYLPRGITIVGQEPFGGAIRMTISGDEIAEGQAYQIVIVDEPMRRVIELKPSPSA
jgi:hypothetical protein